MKNTLSPTLPSGKRAVNLGCGVSIAPGWINLDNSPNARLSKFPAVRWALWKAGILSDQHYAVPWSKDVILHDLTNKMPFEDSSIDYVYASHVLEHLTLAHARKLLLDIYRVLRKGGLVRLVVPDLSFGARRYLTALESNPNDATAAETLLSWLQLSRPTARDPHLWMYDAPSLGAEMQSAGFAKIAVCAYKQGRVPDCTILDNRPGESLHIEGEKVA